MNPDIIRFLLIGFALYMILKTATAPKRGAFLTLFGNIRPETQPRGFMICLVAGYTLAAAMLLAAIFLDLWLPILDSWNA